MLFRGIVQSIYDNGLTPVCLTHGLTVVGGNRYD